MLVQDLAEQLAPSKRKADRAMAAHLLDVTLPNMAAEAALVEEEAREAEKQARLAAQLAVLRSQQAAVGPTGR